MKRFAWVVVLLAFPLLAATPESRELPPGLIVPEAAKPGPAFDVDRATDAYLAVLSDAQREKSDAYFEGGYWITLWDLLFLLDSINTLPATVPVAVALIAVEVRPWLTRRRPGISSAS